ncbi:MAG: FtsX-like permease family protein [Bacteroidota bacterium]
MSRTLITILSVFFAVLLANFMRSVQEGSYSKMVENMVSFFTGYVQIHDNGYWDEQIIDNSFEVVPVLEQLTTEDKEITSAAPRLRSVALVAHRDVSRAAMVIGVDPEKEQLVTGLKNKVVAGKIFENGERSILISDGLAEKLGLGIGDSLVLLGAGYHGSMANDLLPIGGLVHFGNPDLNKRIVYMSIETAQEFFGAPNRLTDYALQLDDADKSKEIVKSLRAELDTSTYEIMDWEEMTPELIQMIEADRGGGVIFMGILYLIIGFGIFGTLLMMTAERKYEFGVLVAIGMKKWRLGLVLFFEILFMAALGVLLGSLFALPLVTYFHFNPIEFTSMADAYAEFGIEPILPTKIDPQIFLSQGIFVFFITIVMSVYPLLKVLGLNPIDSMKA